MLLPFFFTITNCSSGNICHFAHIWVYLGKVIEVELLSPRRITLIDIAKVFCRGACPLKHPGAPEGAFHQTLTNSVIRLLDLYKFHRREIESPCFHLYFPYEECQIFKLLEFPSL